MDERELERQLETLLGGVAAPPNFRAEVRARIRPYRVSRLPEILDLIGWTGVVAAMFVVVLRLLPL